MGLPPFFLKSPLMVFLSWERVWAFEPRSTNRPRPVGDAAPQAQVNPTPTAKFENASALNS